MSMYTNKSKDILDAARVLEAKAQSNKGNDAAEAIISIVGDMITHYDAAVSIRAKIPELNNLILAGSTCYLMLNRGCSVSNTDAVEPELKDFHKVCLLYNNSP